MDWIVNLFANTESVAHIALLYAIVIAIGVYLGKIKIGGISLGVTFVLFAGILAGHVGFTGPKEILTFVQDFGLILFVFMIGLQVGPGFFESFKKGGVTLNMLSASAILLNILVMFGCYYLFFDTSNPNNLPMMVGTLYGAVTNTPGLGAANEALLSVFPNGAPSIANGYACAYPLGVVGIIGATILIKYICKINTADEEEQLNEEDAANPHAKAHNMHLRVENAYITGRTLREVSEFLNRDIVCSRLLHNGEVSIPNSKTKFEVGDELLVVCAEADAEAIKAFIGPEIEAEWDREKDEVQHFVSRRIIVTRPEMNGKTLGKMHFSSVYGVNVTRISRQGMDIFAGRNHHFHVGDKILVVGPEENVNRVAEIMGNSVKRLDAPNIATIFVGIMVGIIFGSLPFAIPGMPVPLKLGIAGGPLIIAILIGRFGYRMKLVTYTTTSANMMLREIGLVLFLASVGIKAGAGFWDTVVQGDGLKYVGCGFLITVIPILIIGTIARLKFKFNYFTIMGMLAGTYTDPPALAYANASCSKEAPAVGYSTVYPLSMFLRIFTAQIVVLFFCGA
ncbi:putative transporter [Segatella copri]|uniref:TrkA C-terminal domain protein n=1 Tax=Segatella copri DSM 18205 TaxID=537011 RepID=D1P979_9BACT|nr:putative transporter [Segatella copri]EFB36690.1 TrkA C-terminal domain protein [Segatella copri DSM 18205]MCW4095770.1 putative transporter [Segatella copri]MDD6740876.1 putative transporter [Segatella copri]MQP20323.1 putative transporter [Segatella copri DSM 18205]UEA42144.1 putative transporter [Segatella copri DSM 18205]